MQPRHHRPDQRKASPQEAVSVYLLIEAEAHARQAARIVELDPDPDAQREAAIVYRVAQRIRARRLAVVS